MNSIQSALLGALAYISLVGSAQSEASREILFQTVASEAHTQTITIVSGTYGQNCGAPRGNATRDLARRCDGRRTCDYVLNGAFGGGNSAACRRDFLAEWRCGKAEFHTAALGAGAQRGDMLGLSCVRENGAGK
jgi:hypothetical protein